MTLAKIQIKEGEILISNEELVNIDLKNLIEEKTGQKFDRNKKIHSPFNAADKTPSFSIYFNSNQNKWMYKDFSTDKVGDAIDFVMEFEGINYNESRKHLGLSSEKTIQELQSDKIENYINWQIKHQDNKKGYELIGLFPFTDSNNNILYYKAKFRKPDNKKDISYYHLDSDNVINKRGCEEVPYNLYSTLQAIKNNDIIIITEGERNANKLNNLLKKGYCATSVKGIRELNKLGYFNGCKIYVCGDSGETGEKYKQHIYNELFRDSKDFKFIRLPGLNKMPDNSDVEDWLDSGHNRSDLLESFNKSLDLKNIYELQQDKHGIYKKVYSEKTEGYKKIYISNFNIITATSLRYIDDEIESIEIIFKTEYGKLIKRNGNVTVLEDVRSFKSFLNSMELTFEGKTDDLITLKKWINNYFIDDSCDIVNGIQFNTMNDKLLFITSNGAIGTDKTYDNIKSDETMDNNILYIDFIGKSEMQELLKHLFEFSAYKNTYSIVGTTINYLAIYQAMKLNIKFSHLFIAGESGSGKSTVLEQVVAALLNYPVNMKKSIGLSTGFSFTKDLSVGNFPVIYDEYKPSMMDKYKIKKISDLLRNAYDRHNSDRGTKDQKINSYKLNRPIIMAGEESFSGNEKALIERSCIVYISKSERTSQNTDAMKWLTTNNVLLNKLGKSLIHKVLSLNIETYKLIRNDVSNILAEYTFLNGRVLGTAINACTGIRILNSILQDLHLPILNDYEKYVVENVKEEILQDGEENYSAVENMLVIYNDMIDNNKTNIGNTIFLRKDILYIKTSEMLNQLSAYKKNYDMKDLILLSKNDFTKQAKKAKYLIGTNKAVTIDKKSKKMDIYSIEKIRALKLDCIVEPDELTPVYDNEPIPFPIQNN